MSKIGKISITIPEKVKVVLAGNILNIEGPLGKKSLNIDLDTFSLDIKDGKEIAIKTQYAWDQQFNSKINVVYGNEWNAGNLSYHLKSRPKWEGLVERKKLDQLKDYMCLDNVCVGSK